MRRASQDWPDAIVFDLDGTLIDSAPDIANALNKALAQRDLAPFSVDKVKEMIGGGVPKLIERALIAHGVSRIGIAPMVTEFITFYQNDLVTETTLYEGARDILEQFRTEGRRLGLCTNKRHDLTIEILQKLDLDQYFSAVIGERAGKPHKPDPAPLRGVMAALGVTADRTVMIGDSTADVGCAKAAEVPCVVVSFGYSRIEPHSLGADKVIDSLSELPAVLRTFSGAETASH